MSEVQILSPRPNKTITYEIKGCRETGWGPIWGHNLNEMGLGTNWSGGIEKPALSVEALSVEDMVRHIPILLGLLLTGCISLSTELQPPNLSVQPSLEGVHCVGVFMGMGSGTNTFRDAMRQTGPIGQAKNVSHGLGNETKRFPPLTKIHSAELSDTSMLGFGERCLHLTGEP